MSIAGNAIPGGGVAGATYTGTVVGDTSFSNQLVLATSGAVVGTEITEFSIVEYNTGCNVDAVDYFSTTNGNTVDGNFVVTESAGSALPDPKGWLIEGSSTNLFLNSDAPVTQPTMAIPIPSLYTLSITGDYVVTVNGSANQTSAADYTFFAATTANVVIVSGTTGTVQIEEGIAATSYIPTLGTARTRGVEELQLPASEYAEAGSAIVTIGTAASGTWFMFSDTAGTNEVGLSLVSSKARLTIITGGVTVAQLNTLASPVEGDKIGVVWVDGDLRIYHNGVLDDSGTGTPPASGDITQLNLGSDDVPSGHINGTLGDFTLFRKALSDEEMISYTS